MLLQQEGSVSRALLIYILLTLALLLTQSCESDPIDPDPTPLDSVALLRQAVANSQECATCHPTHFDEWEVSMHAYALEDPIFQTLNNIGQQRSNNELDQFCIGCHAPVASLLGETPPGFSLENLSVKSANAIGCDVCHKMTDNPGRGLGIRALTLDRVREGNISNPIANDFHDSRFGIRFSFSDICAPCHNIKSPEGPFNLEETNLEWDLSAYAGMGIECQDCHMPAYQGQAAVGGPTRTVHRHKFIGVDYPLIDFPGKQETIAEVAELLENAINLRVTAPTSVQSGDEFTVSVTIQNAFTGHNVPSGSTFERQMWIELIATDRNSGTVLFSTGLLDDNGDLRDKHSEFVQNGTLAEDTTLVNYRGYALDENGEEIAFFWEASSVDLQTIPAFESRTSQFTVPGAAAATTIDLSVRVRFRSFPPWLLRTIGQGDLVSELLVFDMESFQQQVEITTGQ